MMRRYCHSLFITSTALAAVLLPVSAAVAQDGESINISRSDFLLSTEEIIKDVARLETMAASSTATADYASAYEKLQNDLRRAKPPVADWKAEDRNRLRSLPEPSEAAWQALELEERRRDERARSRSEAAQQREQQAAALRREENQLRLAEERLELDAAEKEARIRELEARTDYYEDAPQYYPYYDNLWWRRGNKWRPDPHLQWRPGLGRSVEPYRPKKVEPYRPIRR
jgi:hypothetical protein